jgi:hypothetical protein
VGLFQHHGDDPSWPPTGQSFEIRDDTTQTGRAQNTADAFHPTRVWPGNRMAQRRNCKSPLGAVQR